MGTPYIGPYPSATTDVVHKAYADSISGGGGLSVIRTLVTINETDKATITDAAMTTTSNISVFDGITVDTEENDYEMDPIIWSVSSRATGSFTVQAVHIFPNQQIRGSFWINYIRSN
jgi:hypothetical protein